MTRIFDKVSEGNVGKKKKKMKKKKGDCWKVFSGIENSSTAVFCPVLHKNKKCEIILEQEELWLMNLGESWPTGCRPDWVCPTLAKWQAEFLMVSPIQTKPKAIDKKPRLGGDCDFWSTKGACCCCCCCSYAIHKSCTLIKGHTQAQPIVYLCL